MSDHDLVIFNMNMDNNIKNKDNYKNPYKYKIFEYDVSCEDDKWNNFYNEIDNFDVESIEDMSAEQQLEQMYRVIEESCENNLNKKFGFAEKKRKIIPNNVRILFRKKLRLSKRNLVSDDWNINHKVIEQLEEVENEISNEYNKMRFKDENKAVERMENYSKYFYKYTKKFCKNNGGISRGLGPDG